MPERVRRRRTVADPRRVPEQEAASPHALLALQRTAGNAAVTKLLRSQTYLRATETVANGEKDLNTITGTPNLDKGELPDDLSWWLEGMGAMSTTRYNPGQRHYLYPVGFVIEIDSDAQVLGNYATDANSSTLVPTLAEYWKPFEKMRVALDGDTTVGEPWRTHAGETATKQITDAGGIVDFKAALKTFITGSAVKGQAITLLRGVVTDALRDHYKNPERVRTGQVPVPDRNPIDIILGSGLTPAGLDEMEKALREAPNQTIKYGLSSEAKYTESKLQVRKPDVKGTYYNALRGERPGDDKPKQKEQADTLYPSVPADWTTKKNWHANRYRAADALLGKLGGGTLKKLDDGVLKVPDGAPADVVEDPEPPVVTDPNAAAALQAKVQQLVNLYPALNEETATNLLNMAGGDVETAKLYVT